MNLLPTGRIHIRILLSVVVSCLLACSSDSKNGSSDSDVGGIVSGETISLFNGKDLSSFYTWLPKYGHEDPDQVFTVVENLDGAPAIRINGQHYGGLITREEYGDYKLVAEFRWGTETWEPRKDRARDAGILLHCQGEDGNAKKDFTSPWLRSVEYQIIEGGTGDIILVNGYNRGSDEVLAPRLTVSVQEGQRVWDPEGTPSEFTKGRLDWQYRDPNWKDVLDFRGQKDVEKPVGEWNTIEIICKGGDVTYFLNGVKVNEGKNGSYTKGKILVQSEGAELFFRRIELQSLDI
ncbi:MAG TPA: DUF1080 domain-containing protein [Chryseosolibacter sp.]|nr:DUF1080 domain-containing protein [Chryseosolibacter sp.]